ncbi:MAG: methyltransferase [Candidatus Saccharibacteria bacterium]|nr:methyltransferase [Candidatus Saccharibacteria bacterium]
MRIYSKMKQLARHTRLLEQYPIISDQIKRPALSVVLREFEKTLEVDGDIVELGCYIGTTSLFIKRILDQSGSAKQFYAYDSFEGLPDKTAQDNSGAGEQFKGGELNVSKKQFLNEFHKANLKPPITIKAWFKDLRNDQLPEQISYAFLDGDFYESILDSLRLVWPRLSEGGIITIDDYGRDALPGPERAVRDFFQDKQISLHHEHNIAIIRRA